MKLFFTLWVLAALCVAGVLSSPLSTEELRLIKTSATEPAVWMSQEDIEALSGKRINFMDVTNRKFPTGSKSKATRGENIQFTIQGVMERRDHYVF